MRRRGKNDSYADIIVREKGPDDWPLLTIEIEFRSDGPAFQQMIDRIKETIPKGQWMFDRHAEPPVWRVTPRYQTWIERLALELNFDSVRRIEGALTTDLKTGQSVEQKGLF